MISYAQNFEDVMLWRALKHVENGFYIDVGAWSPDLDSVTRHFYEHGWNGINVEPNPFFFTQYLDKRKKDINLNLAVGNSNGQVEIYFSENPGLSSLDKKIVEGHKTIGFGFQSATTELTTLYDICKKHVASKNIHFLKVDVEGLEDKVLAGNDWSQFRPWIVLVEATLPMSQVENYEQWEHVLVSANYHFVYADGLNRFYVAEEHSELLQSFKYPPNVFDGFILASQVQAEAKASEAEAKASEAEARASEAEARASGAEARASGAEARASEAIQQLNLILGSRSWKITEPLRKVTKVLKKIKNRVMS